MPTTPDPRRSANELLRLAKEATNGWACYAKRKIEHDEIARLRYDIANIEALVRSSLSACEPAKSCALGCACDIYHAALTAIRKDPTYAHVKAQQALSACETAPAPQEPCEHRWVVEAGYGPRGHGASWCEKCDAPNPLSAIPSPSHKEEKS